MSGRLVKLVVLLVCIFLNGIVAARAIHADNPAFVTAAFLLTVWHVVTIVRDDLKRPQ